jgi:RNA polymerase sigma-70 factor (ECF subfamily)
VIDFYRKKREHVDIPDDIASQPEMIVDISEKLAQTVREMMKKLPDKYKEALLLADIENMKQSDLADRLGISLPGAKSRVQRARKMLKDLLLACCHFEFDRYGTVFDYHPKNCSECCEGKGKNHTCGKSNSDHLRPGNF